MKKALLILLSLIVSGMLIGVIWLLDVPATSARYTYTIDKDAAPFLPTITEKNERLDAFVSCLPDELTVKNKDRADRIARALAEMKNDQIERTLYLTDDPQLSEAEIQFENCLKAKGLTPQRLLQLEATQ